MRWVRSEKIYLELDFEPKILVSGEPKWRNLDVTPLIEYYPNPWVDLLYILDRTQNTIDGTPESSSQAFDVRYKVTFR